MKIDSLVKVPGYSRPGRILGIVNGLVCVAILQAGLPFVEVAPEDCKPHSEPKPEAAADATEGGAILTPETARPARAARQKRSARAARAAKKVTDQGEHPPAPSQPS